VGFAAHQVGDREGQDAVEDLDADLRVGPVVHWAEGHHVGVFICRNPGTARWAGRRRPAWTGGTDFALGGAGNSELRGGAGRDFLVDHRGTNRLFGNAGADRLDARGSRADLLNRGPGNDPCQRDRNDTKAWMSLTSGRSRRRSHTGSTLGQTRYNFAFTADSVLADFTSTAKPGPMT
jgi:hypothetical protein